MRRVRLVLLLVPIVFAAACGSDDDPSVGAADDAGTTTTAVTDTTIPVPGLDEEEGLDCSAAEIAQDPQDVRGDVPAPAWDRRAELIDAALTCDYERLQELALEGDGQLSYSFGGGTTDGAAEHWRQLEESGGEDVMRLLVQTLRLPHVIEDGVVTWPSAHQESPGDDDWAAVVPLYGEEQVEWWREGGSGFLGYRVGITEDGDWQFFVAGD